MDTKEERMRENERRHAGEVSAASYDETKTNDKVLAPQQLKEANPSAVSKADDIFGDDEDDEDMFASNPPKHDPASAAKSKKKAAPSKAAAVDDRVDDWDDEEGYYRIMLKETIDSRYFVKSTLGKGVFASVVRALDTKTDKLVAIKIIRKNDAMLKAGRKEIEVLNKLAEEDPDDKKHMVRLLGSFSHRGHLCLVFENLDMNIRELVKKFGRTTGINIQPIRNYARQIFLALSLLKKSEMLHADLKPDNLLVDESKTMIKMGDLGSAIEMADLHEPTPELVSRFYRAPELIIGITADYGIDMWSIGCTLFEMYTSVIPFQGKTPNEMLKSIMEGRGKLPPKMIRRGLCSHEHFVNDATYTFKSLELERTTRRYVTRYLNFGSPTKDIKARLLDYVSGAHSEQEVKEVNLFSDLLNKCLEVNPERRISPEDALKHPFITRPRAPQMTPKSQARPTTKKK